VQSKPRDRNQPDGFDSCHDRRHLGVLPTNSTLSPPAMELFTLNESLKYVALKLDRAVLEANQLAIAYEIEAMRLQATQRETRLAVIRYRQSQNQLAQAQLATGVQTNA